MNQLRHIPDEQYFLSDYMRILLFFQMHKFWVGRARKTIDQIGLALHNNYQLSGSKLKSGVM